MLLWKRRSHRPRFLILALALPVILAAAATVQIRSLAQAGSDPVWTDEFESRHPRWVWAYNRDTGYKTLTEGAGAPSAVEIGITAEATSERYSDCSLHQKRASYTSGVLEMRLRTSDDNGISGPGQGTRGWGFWDGDTAGGNAAWFWSASPESDSRLAGFRALVVRDGEFLLNQELEVDMREWHVYRIEMSTGKTRFLVDGVVVASVNARPENKHRAELWIDNYAITLTGSGYTSEYLDVEQDQQMYVDWVRYYTQPATLRRMHLPVIIYGDP